ncbi:hypothetical protein [Treponema sp.]|uniref:hypothetical protein n=1 Tax=Treponema sp. TaxID=166 RepID=UPI00298E2BC5|nr:hypothetical protein [Treponema sp.]MCQ2241143.1 hypothetical protein [Treponema sp.]
MELVNTKDGFNFKILKDKTLAVAAGVDGVFYCPFCYSQTSETEAKCASCGKNFPELIYYHGDDDTWIASGNESN